MSPIGGEPRSAAGVTAARTCRPGSSGAEISPTAASTSTTSLRLRCRSRRPATRLPTSVPSSYALSPLSALLSRRRCRSSNLPAPSRTSLPEPLPRPNASSSRCAASSSDSPRARSRSLPLPRPECACARARGVSNPVGGPRTRTTLTTAVMSAPGNGAGGARPWAKRRSCLRCCLANERALRVPRRPASEIIAS